MHTRSIGGLSVSLAGLGCNNFGRRIDEDRTRAVVDAALDAGITFLDTADSYGDGRSEEFLGRILEGRRDAVVLATKFGGMRADLGREGGASPSYVRQALEASLRRLRTDRVDLYQLHVPDPNTPIVDTLGALAKSVDEGKIREIGCSNFSADQLREAETAVAGGAPRFVSVQNELSLLARADERDALPAAERLGMAYIPYFPLASGLLTGKYRRGAAPPEGSRLARPGFEEWLGDDDRLAAVERLEAFATERGHSLLELALSWLAAKPSVATVIVGATSAEQVRANVPATEAWVLTDDELAAIDRIAPSD